VNADAARRSKTSFREIQAISTSRAEMDPKHPDAAFLCPASKSSLFEKLDPNLRRKLDRAILNRDPPTYKAAYARFNLADLGVSFAAFYAYARRLRLNAALAESASLVVPDGRDRAALLPEIVADRLLEALLDDDASPAAIERLAYAYRVAHSAALAARRLDARLDDARRRAESSEIDALVNLMNKYVKLSNAPAPGPPPQSVDPPPDRASPDARPADPPPASD